MRTQSSPADVSRPPLGLLLDVDGPIASPETRSIAIPSLVEDLVALTAAGVPVGFVTGRSESFMVEEVAAPLLAHGLAPNARVYSVCEKGGVWFQITAEGTGEARVAHEVAVPGPVTDAVRELAASEFSDTMFFDETKQAMISLEQRTDVANRDYLAAQARFNDAAFELFAAHGLGVRLGEREATDARGEVHFRIDPTIISTDIESITLDKALGAERCLAHFAKSGELPRRWYSVGDSRGDYRMADHLHEAGYDAAHVDVRPSDGMLERPYPIITIEGAINDAAGAEFLARCRRELLS
ncbi:hypothetical protein OH146_01530 [Salinibacterium sp. SYSU T00001]|uniref:hypothetical protein n=1 Tax=Homoserinimonas sedimenticola TaxID=2986805 RepID=UPI002235EE6F|nr:hypothetical protein [Salinibacterium sedimenticola]MCW4384450.1 hypothetical protein [Salinibacterium sedimenticola]